MDELLKKQIEQRAYDLYIQRGGTDGDHINDWLKAELEITNSQKRASNKIVSKIVTPKKTTVITKETNGRHHY